jgi:predicted GIY-YIG superfamily endonuclease
VTQQLYRLYNADDELLYIGISLSAINRMTQHKANQPWWFEVATIKVETHEVDREAIATMEREAIIGECPRYNVVHINGARRLAVKTTPPQIETPATPLYAVNDVLAVGLRGQPACPVGLVTDLDWDCDGVDGYMTLSLFHWMTGKFGAGQRQIRIGSIGMAVKAGLISEDRKQSEGWCGKEPVFDMDPLGDFQTKWKNFHQ